MATITAARTCAYEVVRRVQERGAYADRAFRAEADRHGLAGGLSKRDRALAMRIAYGTVQRRATIEHLVERLTGRSSRDLDPEVAAALAIGLYQVVFTQVADHAAVGESVELAKRARGGGHRLVNAALRRATREGRAIVDALSDSTPAEAALKHSHPLWVAELWWSALGAEEAVALMQRDNDPAESSVRAHTLRASAADVVKALGDAGVRARTNTLVPEAVVLDDPYDVHGSELFQTGMMMPQARASMLVAHALDPQPGDEVLDLCAAPGAKTTHMAALMNDEGRIVAVDLDARRAEAIARNCERLGIGCVEARVGDATQVQPGSYDRVLVDPPCSDLGTLQSRPDARWRKEPAQLERLGSLQRQIVDAGAAAVRPGGRLVYSTCTINPGENQDQIAMFVRDNPDFRVHDLSATYPDVAAGGGYVQTLPHRDGTDGFFIAALERVTP